MFSSGGSTGGQSASELIPLVGKFHYLVVIGLRALFWVLCHVGLFKTALTLSSQQGVSFWPQRRPSPLLGAFTWLGQAHLRWSHFLFTQSKQFEDLNYLCKIPSLCHVLWVGSKSQVLPTLKGRRLCRTWTPGDRGHKDHPKGLPATDLNPPK